MLQRAMMLKVMLTWFVLAPTAAAFQPALTRRTALTTATLPVFSTSATRRRPCLAVSAGGASSPGGGAVFSAVRRVRAGWNAAVVGASTTHVRVTFSIMARCSIGAALRHLCLGEHPYRCNWQRFAMLPDDVAYDLRTNAIAQALNDAREGHARRGHSQAHSASLRVLRVPLRPDCTIVI